MTSRKLLAVLLLIASVACSSKPDGSEFVGKWQQIKGRNTIEFAKAGEAFLLIDGNDKFAATLNQDGTLQVSAPLVGTIVFAYSKASDTVIAMGDEFKRVK